jgi:hypothetical protein
LLAHCTSLPHSPRRAGSNEIAAACRLSSDYFGFVTVTKEVRTESQTWPSVCGCDSASPLHGSIGSEFTQRESGDEMALKIEGIVYGGAHAEEALSGSS